MRPSGAIVLLLLTVIQSACATTKVDDRPMLYDEAQRCEHAYARQLNQVEVRDEAREEE